MTTPEEEPHMSEEALDALAASGVFCERCPLPCLPSIEVAIHALRAGERAGLSIPCCSCADCPICLDFTASIDRDATAPSPTGDHAMTIDSTAPTITAPSA